MRVGTAPCWWILIDRLNSVFRVAQARERLAVQAAEEVMRRVVAGLHAAEG